MKSDNRKSCRVRIGEEVIINRSVRAEGLDISEDGMYVYTKRAYVENSIIDLWLDIDGEKIEISAKVLHSQPGIGFGVSFFDFQPEIREKIRTYANQKINDEAARDE